MDMALGSAELMDTPVSRGMCKLKLDVKRLSKRLKIKKAM